MTDPHCERLDRILWSFHDREASDADKPYAYGPELDSSPVDDVFEHRHGDACDAPECCP